MECRWCNGSQGRSSDEDSVCLKKTYIWPNRPAFRYRLSTDLLLLTMAVLNRPGTRECLAQMSSARPIAFLVLEIDCKVAA